jgi:hypothetical protein
MRQPLTIAITLAAAAALLIPVGPAHAAGTIYDGSDTAFAGSGSQYGRWNQSLGQVGLDARPSTSMPTTRCMDAYFDWAVQQPIIGHNHYDARIVRSCRPGVNTSTDPGGNGVWSEGNWGGATPQGASRGAGLNISDGAGLTVMTSDRFADAGTGAIPQNGEPTVNNGEVRIRTRYQNPNTPVYSCNALPATDPNYQGCF